MIFNLKSAKWLRENLMTVLDSSPVLTIILDSERRVVWVNNLIEQYTGIPSAQAVGRRGGEALRCLHALDVPEGCGFGAVCQNCPVRAAALAAVEAGESRFRVDASLPIMFGRTTRSMHFLVTTKPLGGRDAKFAMVCLEDITDLKETHERLEQANDSLRNAQQQLIDQERHRALAQMASGIAHDFNNALNLVVGFSDLILNDPEEIADLARVRQYVKIMNMAGQDAAATVQRMRQFYRPAEKAELAAVDLRKVIEEAIAMTEYRWKHEARAKGAMINVDTCLEDDTIVYGNEFELREMLTNLILNAIDAMPEGGTLRFYTTRNTERHEVQLTIADSGTGMTAEARKYCLDAFFTTKGEHGTGLGLAIVQGVVSRHGGTIKIDSTPGQGTLVTINLPGGESAAQEKLAAMGRRALDASSLKVLVVEDQEEQRLLILECLRSGNHVVELASNGLEGIIMFRRETYDLVITDRSMPGLSGDEVATAMKAVNPHVPIIMLTGFADIMNAAEERPAAVDLVLAKPVTQAKLYTAIDAVVRVPVVQD